MKTQLNILKLHKYVRITIFHTKTGYHKRNDLMSVKDQRMTEPKTSLQRDSRGVYKKKQV